MKVIETLDEWAALASELAEDGYHLSQWQYDTRHPDGFHARFWTSGGPQIEVVTHSDKVHDAIFEYKAE